MYNNNFSNFGSSSFGRTQGLQGTQGLSSQYQAAQKQYQPVGFVQSFYGQNAGQASQGFGQSTVQASQGWGQATSPESFHTANYRGNQPGHDAQNRSDSSTPAQHGFQTGYSTFSNLSATSPEAFHTASYRGNQPGHDAQNRSDSSTPAQHGFQTGYSSFNNLNTSQYGSIPSQFGYQNSQQFAGSQFGNAIQSNQSYGQTAVSPNAFHTANYRGNQPGHDAYNRSDSSTPTQASFQSQTGFGSQGISSFNQFGQSGQQFGYNSSF